MPTPSELQNERPRRSVFGNYSPAASCAAPRGGTRPTNGDASCAAESAEALARETTSPPREAASLQASIDSSVARTFLYGFLARTLEDPEPGNWLWLTSRETGEGLRSASVALADKSLMGFTEELLGGLVLSGYDEFTAAHIACFGHTVRGDCPVNEIEYGDIKADPLFQPHRLSDLGAFFAAFGLELAPDAAERIDHISIELEFMSVLAAKEAYALEHQADDDALATLRDAQKKFLREHLGRWSPAFARRLARMAEGSPLGEVAKLLGGFINLECARLKVPPGSEDLLLRPVDDSMERLCESCGIHNLPPGAVATGAKL